MNVAMPTIQTQIYAVAVEMYVPMLLNKGDNFDVFYMQKSFPITKNVFIQHNCGLCHGYGWPTNGGHNVSDKSSQWSVSSSS